MRLELFCGRLGKIIVHEKSGGIFIAQFKTLFPMEE